MKKMLIVLTGILLLGSITFSEEEKTTSAHAWGRMEYNSRIFNTKMNSKQVDGKDVTATANTIQILELRSEPNMDDADNWRGFMGFGTKVWDMNLDINIYKIWDNEWARTDVYLTKEINDIVTAKLGTTLNNLTDEKDFLSTIVDDATLTLTAAKDGTEGSITYAVNGQGTFQQSSNPGVVNGAEGTPSGIVGGYIKFPFAGFTVVAKPFKGTFNPTAINIQYGGEFWGTTKLADGERFYNGIELSRKIGTMSLNSAFHVNLGEETKLDTYENEKVIKTVTKKGDIASIDAVEYGSEFLGKIGMSMPLGKKINIISNFIYANESAKVTAETTEKVENTASRNLFIVDARVAVDLSPIKLKGELQNTADLKSATFEGKDGIINTNDIKVHVRADLDMGEFGIFAKVVDEATLSLTEDTIGDKTVTMKDTTDNTLEIGGGVYKTVGLVDLELNSGIILGSTNDDMSKVETSSTEFYVGTQMSLSF